MLAYGGALSQRRLCASGLFLRRAYPSWLQSGSRSEAAGVGIGAARLKGVVRDRSSALWTRVLSSNRTDDSGVGDSPSPDGGEGAPGGPVPTAGHGGGGGGGGAGAHVTGVEVTSDAGKGGDDGIGAEDVSGGGSVGSGAGGGKGRRKGGVFGKWWRGSQGGTGGRKEDQRHEVAAMAVSESDGYSTGSSSSGEGSGDGDTDGGNSSDDTRHSSGGEEDAPSDSMAAIVPAGPRPENFPKVLAVPLTRRPLFPGFFVPVTIK
ncbi:hypothetical protein CBR_g75101, partial [Chara braunii]